MDIHGYPWISMDIHGYPWISMDILGYPWYPWISMDVHGCPWISIDIHGYPWISMDIHGCPWISIDIHGYPWISIDIHWYLLAGSCFSGSPNCNNLWFTIEYLHTVRMQQCTREQTQCFTLFIGTSNVPRSLLMAWATNKTDAIWGHVDLATMRIDGWMEQI